MGFLPINLLSKVLCRSLNFSCLSLRKSAQILAAAEFMADEAELKVIVLIRTSCISGNDSALLGFCEGIRGIHRWRWIHLTKDRQYDVLVFVCCRPKYVVEQRVELTLIWDAMRLMWLLSNENILARVLTPFCVVSTWIEVWQWR